MTAFERIQRILRLVEILQSGRVLNTGDLAEVCGVSRRTIFRDIETLRDSGIAVHFDAERQGFSMPSNLMLPAANFTLPEALAMLVVCDQLGNESNGLPFHQGARIAALKLLSNLPHHLREYLVQRSDAVHVRLDAHGDPSDQAAAFERLSQAIVERHQVRLRYRSLTEWAEIRTVLSPYRLLFLRRNWYVIGRSSLHRSVRTFNVGRIADAEVLPSRFVIPQRFNLDRYLGNAWHLIRSKQRFEVTIRFQKQVSFNVAEVRWHKTQTLKWNADGTLDFSVTVDGLTEIVWWILGYGDQAEVLRPAELREMVAKHARGMSTIYAQELARTMPPVAPIKKRPGTRRTR